MDSMQEILRKRDLKTFENTYFLNFTNDQAGFVKHLYDGLEEIINDYLETKICPAILASIGKNFLLDLNIQWSDYNASIDKIISVFESMDTVWLWDVYINVEPDHDLGYPEDVEDLALTLFRDKVIHHDCIRKQLRKELSDMIRDGDEGNTISNSAAKSTCEILMVLEVKDLIPKENVKKMLNFKC